MDCRKDLDRQHVFVLAEEQKIRLYITMQTSKFPLILKCPLQPK